MKFKKYETKKEFLNENLDDLDNAVKKIYNNVNTALDVGHKP